MCAGLLMTENHIPWWRADRPWGFRFTVFDALVLVAGLITTLIGLVYLPVLAILTPFTLGHFLLFCNVFRIGAERDLLWIAALLVNVGWWSWARPGEAPWAPIVLTQLPVTAILIGHAVLGRNYHGIACEWINPHGYRTGALSEGEFTSRVLQWFGIPTSAIGLLTGRKPAAGPGGSAERLEASGPGNQDTSTAGK
jgi:hypothetical protein